MKYNLELSTRIFEFMADRSRGEFTYSDGNWKYALLRSRYDEETDFIYMLNQCHSPTAHVFGDKANCAGIYSHLTHKLYSPIYDLRFLDETRLGNTTDVINQLTALSTAAILRKVKGNPIEETEESNKPWRSREYYQTHDLEREALACFYSGTQPSYQPKIDKDALALADIIGGINHPNETAERLADTFIARNNKVINQRMWELSLLPAKIAELESTPGEHHYRRRIANSVGDEKMVRLEIMKGGIPCECRIEAIELKRTSDYYYSDSRMDARGRAALSAAYGSCAHVFPSDIQRICYGKKVLYQKEAQ